MDRPGILMKAVSLTASILVVCIGALVLTGWALDIGVLKSVLPDLVTMKANTAVGLSLTGAGLSLLSWREPGRGLWLLVAGIAAAVTAIGALTLSEYFFGWNLGIDQWLFREPPNVVWTSQSGRMAPVSAFCFVLLGGALLAASRPEPARLRLPILAGLGAAVAVMGALALAGCIVEGLLHAPSWNDSGLAIHTAFSFLLLGGALLAFASSRRGLTWSLDSFVTTLFVLAIAVMLLAAGVLSTFPVLPLGVFLSLTISSLGLFFLNAGMGERVGIEKAWQRSEDRFQTVIENMTEGLVISALDGQLLHWNPAALALHGFADAEDWRRMLPEFFRLFELSNLDGSVLPLELWPISRIFRGERLSEVSVRIRRLDIAWARVFNYGGSLVREPSGEQLAFVTISDITERTRSEEALRTSEIRLRSFVEQAPVAIAMLDRNMVYLAASRLWVKDFGGGHTDLVGKCHYDVHPSMPAEWKEVHREGLAGIPRSCDEELWVKADGEKIWLRWAVQPWQDAHGAIGGIMILAENITDRKQAEQIRLDNLRLEEENRRFAEASRLKSEFLANMSHELRTPLNAIIGFTELLADERPGPVNRKQQDYLGNVLNSSRHLLQLINDVLDIAKVEAGKFDFQPKSFVLGQALAEVCAVVRGLASKKQVALTCETSPELGPVTLDERRFKQVCYNLLSNAVKFTDPGGSVEIVARERDAGNFEVRVTDSGIGIKEESIDRLFREFEQLESGSARRYEGTGLGLALTKKLVEMQGGSIAVQSQYGKGSTFTVVLPKVL